MIQKDSFFRRLTAMLLVPVLLFCAGVPALSEDTSDHLDEINQMTTGNASELVDEVAQQLKWALDFGNAEVEENEAGEPVKVNGYPVKSIRSSFSNRDTKAVYEYDSWFVDYPFYQASTTYEPNLACMSLSMALSADRSDISDPGKSEEENTAGSSAAIIRYMTDAGFSDIRLDDYNKTPSKYTVSTAMASRVMEEEGQEPFTLLAVAICGGNYRNEWVSNMTVGTGEFHQGFRYAAGLVTDRIAGYITSRGLKGRVKVWISGFSRSAAVSNITGGLLTDSGMLPKEDVYVYTFATPAGVLNPPKEGYEHIWNILGATDVVPQVAPREWGFGRYGTDLVLPSIENSSIVGMIITEMRTYTAKNHFNVENEYNPAMNLRLRLLVSMILQGIGSRNNYLETYQPILQSIMDNATPMNILVNLRKLMAGGIKSAIDPDILVNYLIRITSSAVFKQEFARKVSGKTENSLLMKLAGLPLISNLLRFSVTPAARQVSTETEETTGGSSLLFSLANEHCEDSYLSSINVMRSQNYFDMSEFCYVMVRGQAKLHLKDKSLDREIMVFTEDGQIEYPVEYEAEDGEPDMYYAERIGNTSIMAIPLDAEYLVTWEATGDGQIECLWAECSDAMTSTTPGARSEVINARPGDTGTALELVNFTPVLPDRFTRITLSGEEMALFLGVTSTAMSWRLMIILGVALISGVICALLCVYLAFKRERRGRGFLFWALLALTGIAAAESEAAYWLFADEPLLRTVWTAAAGLSLLGMFLMRSRRPARMDLPWLGVLILVVASALVYQFHEVTALVLFVLLYLYLAVLFLKDRMLPLRQWIAWGVCSAALIAAVLTIFHASLGSLLWFAAVCGPVALLALFASGSHRPRIRTAVGLLIFANLFMILYTVSPSNPPLHMISTGLLFGAMILLSAGRDQGDGSLVPAGDQRDDSPVPASENDSPVPASAG